MVCLESPLVNDYWSTVNRNGLPKFVNRVIDQIADSPTSFFGKIAAKRLGKPDPNVSVANTVFLKKPIRLLIAPVNYSGQATSWARAVSKHNNNAAAQSMAIEVVGGFSFEADVIVPVSTFNNDPDWQQNQFQAAAKATHMLVEANEPPFGRLFERSLAKQIDALQKQGVKVAYMAHGTEVRLPSRHLEHSQWSYYRDPSVYLPRAETIALRNIKYLEQSGKPIFVSTPDLLLDLPTANWCPVVVDTERWQNPARKPFSGKKLRVAHAPTNPILKGTPLITPTLERLEKLGVIELLLITKTPSAKMPKLFAQTHVMLDQFRLGSYGVAACEAMAAGNVVVGQISDHTRNSVQKLVGLELPIVEANPDNLEEVLLSMAQNPENLQTVSEQSKNYVHEVHNGKLSAFVLSQHFLDL